jgi:glycerol-3-phosphate responsive antiterminator
MEEVTAILEAGAAGVSTSYQGLWCDVDPIRYSNGS